LNFSGAPSTVVFSSTSRASESISYFPATTQTFWIQKSLSGSQESFARCASLNPSVKTGSSLSTFLFPQHYLPFTVARAQRHDAMLRRIEACKGFQTHFPDEHGRLFPFSSNQTPPLEEEYRVLKMTFGQLEFLRAQLGKKRKSRKRKPAKITAAKVQRILHSWGPIVEPGVEEVWPSEFPPVRILRYFAAVELEYDGSTEYDEDPVLNWSVSFRAPPPVIVEDTKPEDMLELARPEPELYLPPHLLPLTTETAYLAAATAAHAPAIDSASPLLDFLFPQAEAEADQLGDPISLMPSLGGGANVHPENPHSMLQDMFSQSLALFNQLFISS
jgi:hypothetical protein